MSFAGLLGGLIFGFGLVLSGMTDTQRVLGFLDVSGAWQPALAVVMGTAVCTTLILFPLVLRRDKPVFANTFSLPTKRAVDARLLRGASFFGLGWGIYGYCPGPAVVALLYGQTSTFAFLLAMVAGMWVASRAPQETTR